MKDEILKVTIEGIRPLLHHNGQLADPLNEYTKRLKVLAKQRDKTDEDHVALHRAEWEGALYFDSKMGPFIPADTLQAVIERGATRRKLGKQFKACVAIEMPDNGVNGFPLKYKGPRDLEGLWSDPRFVFTKGVKVAQKKVSRTRPRFPSGWSVTFGVEVMAGGATKAQVQQAIEDAGLYEGMGDWRPRYGRFVVKSVE
jgi:hypothetical protein